MNNEWNEHDGGACPVPMDTRVIVRNDNSDSPFARHMESDADIVKWANVTHWKLP